MENKLLIAVTDFFKSCFTSNAFSQLRKIEKNRNLGSCLWFACETAPPIQPNSRAFVPDWLSYLVGKSQLATMILIFFHGLRPFIRGGNLCQRILFTLFSTLVYENKSSLNIWLIYLRGLVRFHLRIHCRGLNLHLIC